MALRSDLHTTDRIPLVRLGQGDYTRDFFPDDPNDTHHPTRKPPMPLTDSLITTTTPAPPKMIVYGQPGVGKTTFAAQAGALLIDCENGAGAIPGLTRTPYLKTWSEMKAWLDDLVINGPPEGVGVVAIDTLDWLCNRIVEHVVIELDPKAQGDITNTIGSAHGGYYKAREIVQNIVSRDLLPALNAISEHGVAVLLLAHAANAKMTLPEGYDIRTAAPDTPVWLTPIFTEWADAVLFATRGNDGVRALTTEWSPTVCAKNRYSLPNPLEFSWTSLMNAMASAAPTN